MDEVLLVDSSRTRNFFTHPENAPCKRISEKYNYIFRPKSRWKLVLLSGTVCGIEFCYAAETAFVTPILLSLGLSIKFVTMIWCLSPLIGLFLTPVLGSMSDSCQSKFGRRRPFIMMYSVGILLGLILVPNGNHIGIALGDPGHIQTRNKRNPGTLENKTLTDSWEISNKDTRNFLPNKSFTGINNENFSNSVHKDIKFNPISSNVNPNLSDQIPRSMGEEDIFPNNRKNYLVLNANKHKQDEFSKIVDVEIEKMYYVDTDVFNNNENQIFKSNEDKGIINEVKGEYPVKESYPIRQVDDDDTFTNFRVNRQILNFEDSTTLDIKTSFNKVPFRIKPSENETKGLPRENINSNQIQPWSIVFTAIGTVLLDFCSDACQSPSRTYLLDVSIPSDHAAGLSTFTVMAGLGGSIGYAMGAMHWETTFLGRILGGQVNAVFMIVTIVFLICLLTTVCSFPEMPLSILKDPKMCKEYEEKLEEESLQSSGNELDKLNTIPKSYGSTDETNTNISQNLLDHQVEGESQESNESLKHELANGDLYETVPDKKEIQNVEIGVEEFASPNGHPSLKEYLSSIIYMPTSLRVLCLTNFFCWMSLVCYSLFFTDFVGKCVFQGNPQAAEDSTSYNLYKEGVQFGCWGMAMYSISCSMYSLFIEALVKKIGAKITYIGGQLVYSIGMLVMAITRHRVAVILLSPTAGIMYATLFTMPYLLIAHYHCTKQFSDGKKTTDMGIRGIGTDVAAVSSMVFVSQLILSLSMGSIIEAIGSNVVPVCAAAVLSACGALSATQVTYLDI